MMNLRHRKVLNGVVKLFAGSSREIRGDLGRDDGRDPAGDQAAEGTGQHFAAGFQHLVEFAARGFNEFGDVGHVIRQSEVEKDLDDDQRDGADEKRPVSAPDILKDSEHECLLKLTDHLSSGIVKTSV